MSFWSGEKLLSRLPPLLGSHFDKDCVKSARYTLHVGPEVFVTSSKTSGLSNKGLITPLKPNGSFKIPAGQFAFILTEERVRVPDDALALISIKTSLKFRGLVNVSGFHVDPGWDGHLQFGIYNAGPADVHLRRGQEMFLIWYADLDQVTKKTYNSRPDKGVPKISSEDATNLAGQIYSPQALAAQIRGLRTRLTVLTTIALVILAAVVRTWFISEPKPSNTPPAVFTPAAPAAASDAPLAPPAAPTTQQPAQNHAAGTSTSPGTAQKNSADEKGRSTPTK